MRLIFLLLCVSSLITSCSLISGGNNAGISEKTGSTYGTKETGGYKPHEDPGNPLGRFASLILIPGGSIDAPFISYDALKRDIVDNRTYTVKSFYMDEAELTNSDWKEFTYWIKATYQNDSLTKSVQPNTSVWDRKLGYNEPISNNYYLHPSFNTYPVVGVSWEQAVAYCNWRTNRLSENYLRSKNILEPDTSSANPFNLGVFETGTDTFKPGPNFDPEYTYSPIGNFRLPTEAEWEYAAFGYMSSDANIQSEKKYPWPSTSVRRLKTKPIGSFNANFRRGIGDYSGVIGDENDGAIYPATVKSYVPNSYGLYNMAGNVNEWVEDVFKPSVDNQNDLNPVRGNVYKNYIKDTNTGKYEVNKFGQLKTEVSADDRNYQYGGHLTAISESGDWKSDDMANYETPDPTLLTKTVRVYKGGSWKDLPYWLQPGTRRFKEQKDQTDDIGFRCVIAYNGSSK